MNTVSTTTYTRLLNHLTKHVYKRGQFKGEAPADSTKRDKSHFRVHEHISGDEQTMRVRMHQTDIITAYKDGRVTLDTKGWHGSQTTKSNMNSALYWFGPNVHLYLYSDSVLSERQPLLRAGDNKYRYYDGVTINAQGEVVSELRPFDRKRIDRKASVEFMQGIKESGFKGLFNILYEAAAEPEFNSVGIPVREGIVNSSQLVNILTDAEHADMWHKIIRNYKYTTGWRRTTLIPREVVWRTLMNECKSNMYVTEPSDVFVKPW